VTGLTRRILYEWALVACLVPCVIAAVLAVVTLKSGTVGTFRLGAATDLRFAGAMAEIRHVYAYRVAPAVPITQWDAAVKSLGQPESARPEGWAMLGATFERGHVRGYIENRFPATIVPARYWLLRMPLWPLALPGVTVTPLAIIRWIRRRRDARRRGFAVTGVAAAKPL
jgi:hypothetical protein